MKVYLTKSEITANSENNELAKKIMNLAKNLVSETLDRVLEKVNGEVIVFISGELYENGDLDYSDNLFFFNFSSYGDENNKLAVRKLYRRMAETYRNKQVAPLDIFPNFNGDKDVDEEAPLIQIGVRVFLEKGPTEVVETGACRTVPGGRVDADYICNEIKKAFREKYD